MRLVLTRTVTVLVVFVEDSTGIRHQFTADAPRADVNAALGVQGGHGIVGTLTEPDTTTATRTYCIRYQWLLGADQDVHTLACRSVVIDHSPLGGTSIPVRRPFDPVTVAGWAYEPDNGNDVTLVHLYEDGAFLRVLRTEFSRPDVNAYFATVLDDQPGTAAPYVGYRTTVPAQDGTHTFCAYAIDVGPGANAALGCRTITEHVLAVGVQDPPLTTTPGHTVVKGWAFDPNRTSSPLDVTVQVDGSAVGSYRTTVNRPDVDAAYTITGVHGYAVDLPSLAGSHTYCVRAVPTVTAYARDLGCRTVTG